MATPNDFELLSKIPLVAVTLGAEILLALCQAERVPVVEEFHYPPLGEWVENHWYPSEDGGLITYQRYVTDRKRSEEALRRSEAQLAEGQKISRTGS